MLLSIEGEEKTAKSTFAYTAPLPIVGFAFDIGHDRAINGTMFDKYFKGLSVNVVKYDRYHDNIVQTTTPPWVNNDITIFELPQPVQFDSNKHEGYIKLWDYFISYLGLAVSDSSIKSIVLDTATIARRVKSDAYLEELNLRSNDPSKFRKQLLQIEYGHANDAIRNIYTIMASMSKNFVAIHHLTDEYKPQQLANGSVESAPTGNRILEGLTGSARYFDVCLRNNKDSKTNTITSKILTCGYNLSLEGMPVVPEQNWNSLVELITGSLDGRIQIDKR